MDFNSNAGLSDKLQLLIAKYKEIKERCSILETENQRLEKENTLLRESSGETEGSLQEFKTRVSKQTEEIELLRRENANLRQQIEKLENNSREAADKIDKILGQIEEL
ncbi:MAG: hypothetical protein JW996_03970 [Candidatus Cloacimonetes bacterium]|nr:hypothetical protein [Candidatus Cloacimonadota bacterium]